ncbi:hypothetical protein Tco_0891100 [Tanacetum coccineum]|uniref:Uncharacterized protein n=1 Tax=Tanacetum coccineum TaxID=301880 RepID=A0ABQ5C569_9ASTR
MEDTNAQTRFESVSKHSNDSLLARGNTLRSDEDILKLEELMTLCTTLPNRVLDLEKTKTTQHNEIAKLKRSVKKLEKKNRLRTHKLKRLYKVGLTARVESSDNEESLSKDASKQGRINAIDVDEEITLVSVQNVDEEMFDVNVLDGEEVFVAEQEVVVKDVNNVVSVAGDATTVSAATTTTAIIITVDGKGILIKLVKPMKKKDLTRFDEEAALKLQAEFDEEERLAREKAKKEKEANIALIETWDDIQAKIDVDHQLAERLQAQEQEELSIEEKATLFQQLLEKRRKHFAAKRAEEKRNKPPTKAQQRKIMCTYLKNMEGYKLKDLKLKEFDSIQEMFDRAFKRVNTFEDFRTELVEGKEKRAGTELIQENAKKQKVEDDKETTKLKQLMKIIPDEEKVDWVTVCGIGTATTASSLEAEGNTLRSDEDILKLEELMTLCTTLPNRVLDLEKTKTTQHNEIAKLKRSVKKAMKSKNRLRTHKLKRLYKVGLTARVESSDNEESLSKDASKQGRINAIDVDEEITLVNVQKFSIAGDATTVSAATTTTTTITTIDDITLAQALMEIKSTKPKEKGWDINNRQKIDADHQLAKRLQAQEQEDLSINEKATLFQQLLEKRRKNFAAKRAEEKRNKPPTKAQQRKIMCTYLKNMEGYKLK